MTNNISCTDLLLKLNGIDQDIRKIKSISRKSIEDFDKFTTRIIKEIYEEMGYPTIDKVGSDASKSFGFLLQHSRDLKFVSKVVKSIIKDERILKNIYQGLIPLLADKVSIYENGTQIFGTGYKAVETENGLRIESGYPINDIEQVDERRKKYGLEPLAEYHDFALIAYQKFHAGKRKS